MRILIEADDLQVEAELVETPTAQEIYAALPLEASAMTWGDEIYFNIPVQQDLDDTAREVVEMGDLGYWPTGRAFCIFFGPTPVSSPGEIRPASAVNVIGRVKGDPTVFKKVNGGDSIRLNRL